MEENMMHTGRATSLECYNSRVWRQELPEYPTISHMVINPDELELFMSNRNPHYLTFPMWYLVGAIVPSRCCCHRCYHKYYVTHSRRFRLWYLLAVTWSCTIGGETPLCHTPPNSRPGILITWKQWIFIAVLYVTYKYILFLHICELLKI